MKNKIYNTFDEAVADVPDGSTVMIPGFGGIGMPRNLIAALNRQGAKELTGVSNNAGNLDDKVDVSTLVEARQMKKMICALAERMRAAGSGIGGFYTPSSVGTELAEGKEHREINGRMHVLEYPLFGDYAFIRAWKADTFGNLQFRLTQRNFNVVMAMAATVTVVEVENEVVEAGGLDPDNIHVPGIYVNRIVKIPADGIWY